MELVMLGGVLQVVVVVIALATLALLVAGRDVR